MNTIMLMSAATLHMPAREKMNKQMQKAKQQFVLEGMQRDHFKLVLKLTK